MFSRVTKPTVERRRGWKTIRRLVIAQFLTLLIAITAFTVATIGLIAGNQKLATQRTQGRLQTCQLDRQIIYAAIKPAAKATLFLSLTPLADCQRYSRKLP